MRAADGGGIGDSGGGSAGLFGSGGRSLATTSMVALPPSTQRHCTLHIGG